MKTSHRSFIHLAVVVGMAVILSFSAQAATPNVDAGSLLRQNEQELNLKKSTPPILPDTPAKSVVKTSPDDTIVYVRSFAFTGNALLSSDELNHALATFVNRELTLAQLREAANVVINIYRSAGWIANAYLPKQEIQDGVVAIQIVEAKFGGAQLEGLAPQHVHAQRLINMAEAILPKGRALHANDIDRALLLLDDLSGVSVTGSLVAGQRDGETNLAISAIDDAWLSGSATADNQGSLSTGADRDSINLNLNSPLRLGDALSLTALKTLGSEYQRLGYTLPVGAQGWRAGVHASNLRYHVITFSPIDLRGTATTAGMDISYPLIRGQLQNVNVGLNYDDKQFDNSAAGVSTTYGIKVYSASLAASQIDSWVGGGINSASVAVTGGDKNTDGRYKKLNLSLSRLQSLNGTWSLFVAASSQIASKNLDSSEKIYLGGANGVRAYPASEAGGSEGSTLTLELRQRFDNKFSVTGFYDCGWVKVNRDNNIASPASPNSYHLQGYGISLAWQVAGVIDLKATLSQRIGNNPAANSNTGMDGDGTRTLNRIWLTAGLVF